MNETAHTLSTDGNPHYVIIGGYSHGIPEHPVLNPQPIAPEGCRDYRNFEHYATLADAVYAWRARRNDWSGRFPMWGDGCHGDGCETSDFAPIGYVDNRGELIQTWSLADAFEDAGIVDDVNNYFESFDDDDDDDDD